MTQRLLDKLKDIYNKFGNIVIAYDFDDTVYPYSDTPADYVGNSFIKKS